MGAARPRFLRSKQKPMRAASRIIRQSLDWILEWTSTVIAPRAWVCSSRAAAEMLPSRVTRTNAPMLSIVFMSPPSHSKWAQLFLS
jgi:hypothetical protein